MMVRFLKASLFVSLVGAHFVSPGLHFQTLFFYFFEIQMEMETSYLSDGPLDML